MVVEVNLTILLSLTTLWVVNILQLSELWTVLWSFMGISSSLPQTAAVKMIDIWMVFTMMYPFTGVMLQSYLQVTRHHILSVATPSSIWRGQMTARWSAASTRLTTTRGQTKVNIKNRNLVRPWFHEYIPGRRNWSRLASPTSSPSLVSSSQEASCCLDSSIISPIPPSVMSTSSNKSLNNVLMTQEKKCLKFYEIFPTIFHVLKVWAQLCSCLPCLRSGRNR